MPESSYCFDSETTMESTKKKRSQLTFPWWCLFIAYGLSLILVGLSMVFIIARGIEFGDLKTQKWLTSIITGFFSSIFLTQPIKIVCLAIFFICFCRNSNDEKEENGYINEDDDQFEIDQDDLQTIEVCFVFKIKEKFHHLFI
jgi:hypothetical protein